MIVRTLLFAIGCLLMALNLAGLALTMRPADLAQAGLAPGDLRLSHAELLAQVPRRPGEPGRAYIYRLTTALSDGMAHYWGESVDRYRLRVPAWENYLLYAASFVRPDLYRKYEFARPDKAMERGVGLCSQQSVILATLLRREGLDAQLQHLEGHVVVRVRDEAGRTFLADADYGTVIPHEIAVVERRPELVRRFYDAARTRPSDIAALVAIYGAPGNRESTVHDYFYGKLIWAERLAYALKWLIPLLLAAPLLLALAGRLRRRRRPTA